MAVKATMKRRETEYSKSVTTVRLTYELKDLIVGQGRYDESIDEILRRLWLPKDLVESIMSQAKPNDHTLEQVLRRLLRLPAGKNGVAK